MFPVTTEYLKALHQSHARTTWANIYTGNQVLARRVRIVSGSITADSTQDVRYTGNVTLDFDLEHHLSLDTSLINVYTTRISIHVGMIGINQDPTDLRSNPLVVPLGLYRVENTSRADLGLINVDLGSFEGYVRDDLFISPRKLDDSVGKVKTIDIIKKLINETFAPHGIGIDTSGVAPGVDSGLDVILSDANKGPYDVDRWACITSLADSINVDVFAGPDGRFYIRDKPAKRLRYQQFPAVWTVNKGNDGVLTNINSSITRDNVYNAVVAQVTQPNNDTSSGSEVVTPPVTAVVRDTDPNSPVYWFGPFGRKPLMLDPIELDVPSGSIERQAAWYAMYRLNDAFGENREMNFNSVPNYALEPDDLVYVETPDGIFEKHQLVQVTYPLDLNGTMSATTKAKSDLKFIIWGEIPPSPDAVAAGTAMPSHYVWNKQTKRWSQARRLSDLVP